VRARRLFSHPLPAAAQLGRCGCLQVDKMQLKVAVRTLADKRHFLDANVNDSVDKFQAMLEKLLGTPISEQTLLLKERGEDSRMQKGRKLLDYDLTSKDEVLLVRSLPKRPSHAPPKHFPAVPMGKKAGGRRQVMPLPSLPPFAPPQCEPDAQLEPQPTQLTPLAVSRPLLGQVPMVRPPSSGAKVAASCVVPVAQAKNPRDELAKAAGVALLLPVGRAGIAAATPRCCGESGAALSQPCTPRTPATPHPVASWAPPPLSAPTATTIARGGNFNKQECASSARHAVAGSSGAAQAIASIRPAPASQRIRRVDLERVGRLGVGAFGVVTLEVDRRTGRTFALKAVSKGYLAQLHMEHSVLNEKRILNMVETPFIVRLLATYNGREHVYFLLEAALGGELFTTYERLRLYGSEPHARFYVGCCVEAIAHLHERHVIYRDLKPENLLLDNRGYCKLTDMGLAKVSHSQTFTLVGTPDYMAPEVINLTGHNQSVDWWMLGVLLFELLVGRPPFEADTTEKVYEAVRKGINAVRFPAECRKAQELVRALCAHEPGARIAAGETRRDQWFRGFDWQGLRELRIPAPHVPKVRGPRDLGNFRSCDQEDPPRVPYKDKGTGWDLGFEDDTPNPAVAAQVGALPLVEPSPQLAVSSTTTLRPTVAAEAAHIVRAPPAPQAKPISPRQATRVPPWAWTSSAAPAKQVASTWGPPMLQISGGHPGKSAKDQASMKAAAAAWAQREVPTSPHAAPAAGGG